MTSMLNCSTKFSPACHFFLYRCSFCRCRTNTAVQGAAMPCTRVFPFTNVIEAVHTKIIRYHSSTYIHVCKSADFTILA